MSDSSKCNRLKGFFKNLTDKPSSRTPNSNLAPPSNIRVGISSEPSASQALSKNPTTPIRTPEPKVAPPRITNKQAWLSRGISALNVLGQVASSTDILSPLKIATDAATKVLETVKAMDDNDEAWKALRKTLEANIVDFQKQIQRLENEDMADDEDSPLFGPIEEYKGALEELLGDLLAESGISEKELKEETKGDYWMHMKRFMSRFGSNAARIGTLNLEASRIKLYTGSLNDAMQRFLVSMTLYMAFELQEANQKLTRVERFLSRKPTNREINAHGRQHRECLEGTRVAILRDIDEWSQQTGTTQIYCIEDLAGTGKSTIAYHLANKWEEEGRLAARFFFTRGNTGTETASELCFAIAEELAVTFRRNTEMRAYVKDLLEDKSALSRFSIHKQWAELVVAPLEHLKGHIRLLVIDALDECSSSSLPSLLDCIQAFSLNHIKILITTRPEDPIRRLLGIIPSITMQHIRQSETEKQVNLADVALYINHELDEIYSHADQRFSPTTTQRQALIDRAEGLFIFASTACSFLRMTYVRQEALEQILASKASSKLDGLYMTVLGRSIPDSDADIKAARHVISLIIAAAEPISVNVISSMLASDVDVRKVVRSLASVVSSSGDDEPVYIIHTTFREFLLQKRRSSKYAINIHIGHSLFARSSFGHILGEGEPIKVDTCDTCKRNGHRFDELRRDICHAIVSGSPFPMNKDIQNLEQRLAQHVSPGLRYAAIHWISHAVFLLHKDEFLQTMIRFFRISLLHWIELLGLLGALGTSIVNMNRLQHAAQKQSNLRGSDIYRLIGEWIKDILNLMRINQSLLEASSFHIYTSALLWHNPDGLISKNNLSSYAGDIPHIVWGLDKDERKRDSLIGHSEQVGAIAFSPNGEYLASLSVSRNGHSSRIIQWDAACYAKLWELNNIPTTKIHMPNTRAVLVYSPDSRFILSLTWDALILMSIGREDSPAAEIWRWIREQDNDLPSAIVWHPKGEIIFCGMRNGDLLLANSTTGGKMERVPAHSKHIYHLRISNNGGLLASVSMNTIAIWVIDPDGKRLPALNKRLSGLEREGYYVVSFVSTLEFLDNSHVAYVFASYEPEAIYSCSECYIWDLHEDEGKRCKYLEHFGQITLSKNGVMAHIDNGFIQITDIHTGEVLKKSPKLVHDDGPFKEDARMIYSPSSKQIYVCVHDGRIIVWDLNKDRPSENPPLHGFDIRSLSLSADLSSLTYESYESVNVWDIAANKPKLSIGRYLDHILHGGVTLRSPLSHDGSRRAIMTSSNQVLVYDVMSGAVIGQSANFGDRKKYRRWSPISIALSHDGTQIATVHQNFRLNRFRLFIWKLREKSGSITFECEVLVNPGESLYVDLPNERIDGVVFHKSGQHLLFRSYNRLWTWDVTDSSPTLADPEFVPHLLAETASDSYVQRKTNGLDWILMASGQRRREVIEWIVIGSPPRYSFALPTDFEISKYSVRSNNMALALKNGRILIVDFAHLMEPYPLDVEYWKSIVEIWETTDENISMIDEGVLVIDEEEKGEEVRGALKLKRRARNESRRGISKRERRFGTRIGMMSGRRIIQKMISRHKRNLRAYREAQLEEERQTQIFSAHYLAVRNLY